MPSNTESPSLEHRFDFSISKDEVQKVLDARLKRIAKTAKVHGFRPGKAPLKVIAQKHGKDVRLEVIGEMLEKNFNTASQDKHFDVIGQPRFEEQQENDETIGFSAVFEVYPEIILGDLSQVNVERPVIDVQDSDVDNTLQVLRKQHARYETVVRPVELGDRVHVDYQGTIDSVKFEGGSAENIALIVGEGKLLKDFEESIIGMSQGQNKTFEVTFPENYHGKELAGKLAVFEVEVNSVEMPVLPEIDAEFAKSLGVSDGDTEKMRLGVKQNIEWELSKRIRDKVKNQVLQSLLDKTEFEVPKSLLNNEAERLLENTRQSFKDKGVEFDDEMYKPELFHGKAENRVRLGLIFEKLMKVHKFKSDPEQVLRIVKEMAQQYENPDEVVKWHYDSPERLKDIEAVSLEDNIVMWVLQQVNVVSKPMTFDEIMKMGLT